MEHWRVGRIRVYWKETGVSGWVCAERVSSLVLLLEVVVRAEVVGVSGIGVGVVGVFRVYEGVSICERLLFVPIICGFFVGLADYRLKKLVA